MKISKVDHIKVAVANDGQNTTAGILYIDPDKSGKIQNKEEHIQKRITAAQSLFAIYNPIKNKKVFNNVQIDLISFCNVGFKTALKNKRSDFNGFVADVKKTIESKKSKCRYEFSADAKDIEKISRQLRGIYAKEEYKSIISGVIAKSLGIKDVKCPDVIDNRAHWDDFVMLIYEDYTREKVLRNAKKSLNNQNLVIQYDAEDNTLKPAVICAASSRKTREKEGLRRFLILYANLDDSKRNEIRIKLRRLVNLYFYGMDEVPRTERLDVWGEHSNRRKTVKKYVEPVIVEKNGKFGPTKKLSVASTRERIREQNAKDYRRSMTTVNGDEKSLFFSDTLINEFWIHHIESDIERITSNVDIDKQYKLELGYLSEKVWKGIINYICIKYIAIGKALYHFGMNDLVSDSEHAKLGCIVSDKVTGITSFDYEQIKAEENLQREIAVYVAFAVNNLSTSTVMQGEKNEDILTMSEDSIRKIYKPKVRRNVLQFFGGESEWNKVGSPFYGEEAKDEKDIELLLEFKKALYSVRNESFHYHTLVDSNLSPVNELITAMFEYDSNRASKIQRDKFYSNNLHMFYSINDIKGLVEKLYSEYSIRASQVPSFNSVFTRNSFEEYVRNDLKINATVEPEDKEKWLGSLYYVFKEIYYNDFLQNNNLKHIFVESVRKLAPRESQRGDEKAIENFRERIKEIDSSNPSFSFAQICQIIMTEQNLQNSGNQRGRSSKTNKEVPAIYKHYKMLLFKSLRNAFADYVKTDKYAFLSKPVKQAELAKEEFLPDLRVNMFSDLSALVKDNSVLQNWYILCRLLAPKQQNLLAGTFRHYIQYSEDVARRANQTNNPLSDSKTVDRKYIKDVIRIIDMCIQISGGTSNNVMDYFDDEDAFADYVLRYYDIGKEYSDSNLTSAAKLRSYCNSELSNGQKVGLFYDGENPILNRNIVLAKLYGADNLIYKITDKISTDDIESYYRQSARIAEYRKNGKSLNDAMQRQIKAYQEIKNKVELRDVVDYSEIVNELQGQLINWSYLRERDFMYFQLGFHYNCLQNADCEKPQDYIRINTDDKIIEGAILYQIAAIYTYGLPIFIYKNGICPTNGNVQTSVKVKDFINYTKGSISTVDKYSEANDLGLYFDAGYEVFGVLEEQQNITDLRNYIDHFHYYARQDRSLLDIFSEVFDRFFTYDMKYQKNVINLIYNILLAHFVDAEFAFENDPTKRLKKNVGRKTDTTKDMATIRISKKGGARADSFTYKFEDGSSIEMPAKSKEYVREVIKLLYYPNIDAISDDMIKETETKSRSAKNSKRKNDKKSKSDDKSSNTKSKNESSMLDVEVKIPATADTATVKSSGPYKKGDIVEGKVVYVDKKGRFVTLDLTDKVNKSSFKPGDKKYKYGDIVKVRIKNYNSHLKQYDSTVVG